MSAFFDWIEGILTRLYARVDRSAYVAPQSASGYRIFVGAFLLLLLLPTYGWVAEVPSTFYFPQRVSPYYYLPGFPPRVVAIGLDVLLALAATAILTGYRTRLACWAFVLAFVVARGYGNSFGKVGHALLLPTVVLCFSLTDWGKYNALAPDRGRSYHKLGCSLAALAICFGMFTAGWPKLVNWVDFDFDTSGFLNWFYSGYFNFGRSALLMEWVFYFPPWMTELLDYGAVALELSPFLFLLVGPRAWRLWLVGASTFHLGTDLFLNIHFVFHLAVYCGFFCQPLLEDFRLDRRQLRRLALWGGVAGVAHVILRVVGLPARSFFVPFAWEDPVWMVWVCVPLWVGMMVAGVRSIVALSRS